VGILEDFLAMQAADPAFDPARPVEPAYVRLPGDVESGILIEDRRTARVADLCNTVYEVTLQVLARYYGDSLTLRESALKMGISEARACQLHGRAIFNLRRELAALVSPHVVTSVAA